MPKGLRPNTRLQRTRPLWRVLMNLNGSGWGLAAEGDRYSDLLEK
jgi:hypothetical protein